MALLIFVSIQSVHNRITLSTFIYWGNTYFKKEENTYLNSLIFSAFTISNLSKDQILSIHEFVD